MTNTDIYKVLVDFCFSKFDYSDGDTVYLMSGAGEHDDIRKLADFINPMITRSDKVYAAVVSQKYCTDYVVGLCSSHADALVMAEKEVEDRYVSNYEHWVRVRKCDPCYEPKGKWLTASVKEIPIGSPLKETLYIRVEE